MKNSAKVVFALIVTVVVTGYVVSCSSKNETTSSSSDTTKIDSAKVIKLDTTVQSTDTTASH